MYTLVSSKQKQVGSTVCVCNLKTPSSLHLSSKIFLATKPTTKIFLLAEKNILGVFNKLVFPNLCSIVCFTSIGIHGILSSSSTSTSVSAFIFSITNQTQEEQILSLFLAIKNKNLSVHSLTLPKDVCPWWVLLSDSQCIYLSLSSYLYVYVFY